MYTFTHSTSYFLNILSTSTMNAVIGFETGEIDSSPIYGCVLKTTVPMINPITIVTGTNDIFAYQYLGHDAVIIKFSAGGPYTGSQFLNVLNNSFNSTLFHYTTAVQVDLLEYQFHCM